MEKKNILKGKRIRVSVEKGLILEKFMASAVCPLTTAHWQQLFSKHANNGAVNTWFQLFGARTILLLQTLTAHAI
jgi:hypothetical protein